MPGESNDPRWQPDVQPAPQTGTLDALWAAWERGRDVEFRLADVALQRTYAALEREPDLDEEEDDTIAKGE